MAQATLLRNGDAFGAREPISTSRFQASWLRNAFWLQDERTENFLTPVLQCELPFALPRMYEVLGPL